MTEQRPCLCGCGARVASRSAKGFASQACYLKHTYHDRFSPEADAEIRRLHAYGYGATRIGDAMVPRRSKGQIARRMMVLGLLAKERKAASVPNPLRAQRSPVGPTLRPLGALHVLANEHRRPPRASAPVPQEPRKQRTFGPLLWHFWCPECTERLFGPAQCAARLMAEAVE